MHCVLSFRAPLSLDSKTFPPVFLKLGNDPRITQCPLFLKACVNFNPAWRKTSWPGKNSKQPLHHHQTSWVTSSFWGGKKFNSLCVYVTVRLDPSCLKAAALTVCDVMYLCQLNEVYSGNRKIIEFSAVLFTACPIIHCAKSLTATRLMQKYSC